MRVVCISAECEPWAKTGGLGDVVDALARAVGARRRAGQEGDAGTPHVVQSQVWVGTGAVMGVGDGAFAGQVERPVDVFLPKYRGVEAPADATSRSLPVPDPLAESGVTVVTLVEFEARGYRVRLVDYPPAFDRDSYYGDENGDYPDNGWRFGLLSRAALEALLVDGRPVDVLHLHDWQAMPAVLLRDCAYEAYPLISRAAVMATIHNLAYQGWLTRDQAAGLAFPDELKQAMKPHADGILLLREGIDRAELVNTVSPGYAREALTPAFGMGLDPALAGLGHRFGGILNGLDMTVWDPATDAELPANYSRSDMAGKAVCRRALLTELGFDPGDDGPMLSMIGRLDPQKGFDLLAGAAPELIAAGARIVALGTGDPKLIAGMRAIATQHPESVAIVDAFDRALARRIYAGADLYLMPSRFEPCGQGQMIAMRYGTPAVVRRTGGLADTVVDVREWPDEGTGFLFDTSSPKSLANTCRRAMEHQRRGGEEWAAMQDRGMAIDWSWEAGPAEQYAASYRRALSLRRDS
ncbi:MAG TPA: glycogen synthase [Candidatus Limnocylindrales bacterium]|jgi:glycogen/starch synthases, ADP-glucose type|nr:glycogen synthase [Candidatus Limnocylindrales bacterium]